MVFLKTSSYQTIAIMINSKKINLKNDCQNAQYIVIMLGAIFVINNELLLGTGYLQVNRCPHDLRAMLSDAKIKGRQARWKLPLLPRILWA